ncbi:Uu.00g069740.m01.CDS01 [Anthostomella pinea]|uniref:Uu.00g069740.m01.CDS01 n=1 Tax=Anthostomella pinea TaxID=933095 RepID=A0AAI8VUK9_9PEZI|nr:Uu.00g069740.m01.CDS01 [Anthostomella pinea]
MFSGSRFGDYLKLLFSGRLSSLLAFVVIVCGVARLVSFAIRRAREYKVDSTLGRLHGCQLPPELPKRWPLGIDRIKELWDSDAGGPLLAFLCSIAKDYEPRNNLSQYLLFGPRAFHVLNPKNLEAVLSTNLKDYGFGCRPAVFAPLLGNGIFPQEGPAWKHSRELLRKQFARTQYQKLDHFKEHVDNLIACIPSNGEVDLQPLFFNLTLDTTTALLFGRSVYSLRAGIGQAAENLDFAESFTSLRKDWRSAFASRHSTFSTALRDFGGLVMLFIASSRSTLMNGN